jgi:hypothetical protein
VPDDTLRLPPAVIAARLSDWRQLIDAGPAPVRPGTSRSLVER